MTAPMISPGFGFVLPDLAVVRCERGEAGLAVLRDDVDVAESDRVNVTEPIDV